MNHLTAAAEALQSAARSITAAAQEPGADLTAGLTALGGQGLHELSEALWALDNALGDTTAAQGIGHAAADIDEAWGHLEGAVEALKETGVTR